MGVEGDTATIQHLVNINVPPQVVVGRRGAEAAAPVLHELRSWHRGTDVLFIYSNALLILTMPSLMATKKEPHIYN